MLKVDNEHQIFVYTKPIDMRKAIDGLSFLVIEGFDRNPQDGSLYLFYNRTKDKVKALYWDKNGFVMHYKRLESSKFKLANSYDKEYFTIDAKQLQWLLAGLDFVTMKQFEHLDYSQYY